MSYGRWQPLDAAEVPAGTGVLQARLAQGLLDYPRGKSAMVYYDGDDARLGDAMARLRAALPEGAPPIWVRFAAPPMPSLALAEELRRFRDRFGAPPRWNR